MVLLHSPMGLGCFLLAMLTAFLCRLGKAASLTAFLSMAFVNLLMVLALVEGASMYEALAYLLLPLGILLGELG